jgi:hypothetical protein
LNIRGEPGYPARLIVIATWAKAVLQMLVAAYAVGWLTWSFFLTNRIHNCVASNPQATGAHEQFCYLIPPANVAFQIIASALAAATVIELAFTLFTPGPDEALDPVLLAIASALLFQLGKVDQFHWQDGLAVVLYGMALGALFVVRVFIAPDEDRPPKLWWWLQRHPPPASDLTVPSQRH